MEGIEDEKKGRKRENNQIDLEEEHNYPQEETLLENQELKQTQDEMEMLLMEELKQTQDQEGIIEMTNKNHIILKILKLLLIL